MTDKDISMPEEFLALLEETNASKGRAKAAAKDSKNPVISERKYGSKKRLFPFGTDKLEGYRLPDSDVQDIAIICGNAKRLDGIVLTVSSKDREMDLVLDQDDVLKLERLIPGVRITAAVKDGKCLALKLGPFFGDSLWKLFYKNNTKSVTEFVVR